MQTTSKEMKDFGGIIFDDQLFSPSLSIINHKVNPDDYF